MIVFSFEAKTLHRTETGTVEARSFGRAASKVEELCASYDDPLLSLTLTPEMELIAISPTIFDFVKGSLS